MLKMELLFFIATAGALLFVNRAAPQTTPAAAPVNAPAKVRNGTREQRKAGNFTPATASTVLSDAGASSRGGKNAGFTAGTGTDIIGDTLAMAVNTPQAVVGYAFGYFGFDLPNALRNTPAEDAYNAAQRIGVVQALKQAPAYAIDMVANYFSDHSRATANEARQANQPSPANNFANSQPSNNAPSAPSKADAPSPANNFRGAGGTGNGDGSAGGDNAGGDNGPGNNGRGAGGNR